MMVFVYSSENPIFVLLFGMDEPLLFCWRTFQMVLLMLLTAGSTGASTSVMPDVEF